MDVYAHRGSWIGQKGNDGSDLVENTLAAYARAFEIGADGFECDARRTADDALVVHHDAVIDGVGAIVEHTFAELRALRPDIPTLAETLATCRGKTCNVEIKNMPPDPDFDPEHRIVGLVAEVLASVPGLGGVVVSSFNLATLDAYAALGTDARTGWLIGSMMQPVDALSVVIEKGHSALHPNVATLTAELAPRLGELAADEEVALNAWTVNAPDVVAMLASYGFASVITDDVAMATDVLGT